MQAALLAALIGKQGLINETFGILPSVMAPKVN
jgi:hypothetical protein